VIVAGAAKAFSNFTQKIQMQTGTLGEFRYPKINVDAALATPKFSFNQNTIRTHSKAKHVVCNVRQFTQKHPRSR